MVNMCVCSISQLWYFNSNLKSNLPDRIFFHFLHACFLMFEFRDFNSDFLLIVLSEKHFIPPCNQPPWMGHSHHRCLVNKTSWEVFLSHFEVDWVWWAWPLIDHAGLQLWVSLLPQHLACLLVLKGEFLAWGSWVPDNPLELCIRFRAFFQSKEVSFHRFLRLVHALKKEAEDWNHQDWTVLEYL